MKLRIRRRYRRLRERVFVRLDSKRLSRFGNILFVDAGSNLGQGYSWISKRYGHKSVTYHLFEANPNCYPFLEKLIANETKAKLFKSGIGPEDANVLFYGLAESEGGSVSQGGSTVKQHNFKKYTARDENAIEVPIVDFSDYLVSQAGKFDKIVVKMDVEGAEYDILESLEARETLSLIDTLYVEFHSRVLPEAKRLSALAREQNILAALKRAKVRFRIWH